MSARRRSRRSGKHRLAVLGLGAAAWITFGFGCGRSLEGQPCPCVEGWTCCTTTSTCVRDPEQSCRATTSPEDVPRPSPGPAVRTQRYDNRRSGENRQERHLNPKTVAAGRFGKRSSRSLRGAVHAQPLYLPELSIPSSGDEPSPALIVATMQNYVYALDARQLEREPHWVRQLAPHHSRPRHLIDPEHAEVADEIGVWGTPVISESLDALYVVAASEDSGTYTHLLYKLSLADGSDLLPPVTIAADGFWSELHAQQSGLLLAGDTLYVGFGSYLAEAGGAGWLFAYDTELRELGATKTRHRGIGAGIRMSGHGLVEGARGDVLFTTDGGTLAFDRAAPLDADALDLASGVGSFRLSGDGLTLSDWFAPATASAAPSSELGAAGPVLAPGSDRVIVGGERRVYVLDADDLGFASSDDAQVVQKFRVSSAPESVCSAEAACYPVRSAPVFWSAGDHARLFVWAQGDDLRAFRFDVTNGQFECGAAAPSYCEPIDIAAVPEAPNGPGGILSVSSDEEEGAVLWAAVPRERVGRADGSLRAHDARDLRRELWSSERLPARDAAGLLSPSVAPLVAGGSVYLPTQTGISSKVTLNNDRSSDGPALTALGDRALVVAWASTSVERNGLRVAWSEDGLTFSQKSLLTWSPYEPSLASSDEQLFVAWSEVVQDVARVRVLVSSEPDMAQAQPLGERTSSGALLDFEPITSAAPAVAYGDGTLYVAWRSEARDALHVISSSDARHVDSATIVTVLEPTHPDASPGLFFANDTLSLYWVAPEGTVVMAESRDGGRSFGARHALAVRTPHRPAVAALMQPGQSLPDYALFWVNAPSITQNWGPLAVVTAPDADMSRYGKPVDLRPDNGMGALGAATFRGSLYVAWTGPNESNFPNVARYSTGGVIEYGSLQ